MSTATNGLVGEIVGHEFDSFRGEVTRSAGADLAASKIEVGPFALDSFYNQAWFGVYARIHAGEPVGIHEGLLTEIAKRRAVDEFRTAHPDRHLDYEVLEAVGIADPLEETVAQQKALHARSEYMRAEFNMWELQAATLHCVFGYPLPDAAQKVGMNAAHMEPVVADITGGINDVLGSSDEVKPCADRAGLINQFAFGVFGPRSDEYREAVKHLEACPGCRKHVLTARTVTAVTISSRAVVVALTGGIAAGAPRAASPVAARPRVAPETERRAIPPIPPAPTTAVAYAKPSGGGRRKAIIAAAVAALLIGGFGISNALSGGGSSESSVKTAQTDSQAAADKRAKAKAAKAKRKARAAKKHRAEKRRATKRRHARERAAAARRRAAATQNASATVPAQTQQPVAVIPQQAPAATPKPKATPAPSTDPSQEFPTK